MTWAYALQIFSEMKNSWVVDDSYEGYAEIPLNMMKVIFPKSETSRFTQGICLEQSAGDGFPHSYRPCAGLLQTERSLSSDFYFCRSPGTSNLHASFFSYIYQGTGQTVRLSSLDPTDGELDIIEVLMASTAIPVAFQPRLLTGLGSSTDFFVDGGTGIDQLPTTDLLQEPFVTHIYALSYGSAVTSGGDSLPKVNLINTISSSSQCSGSKTFLFSSIRWQLSKICVFRLLFQDFPSFLIRDQKSHGNIFLTSQNRYLSYKPYI